MPRIRVVPRVGAVSRVTAVFRFGEVAIGLGWCLGLGK